MDTNVTEVYETIESIDVNKQVPYQQNMDFSQENFTMGSQMESDGFPLEDGEQYNAQPETAQCNSSDQPKEYQDPGLENPSNQSCTIEETDIQQSYNTTEETKLKQSSTINGLNEDQTVAIVEPEVAEITADSINEENLTEAPVESNEEAIGVSVNLINQTAEDSINPVESSTDSGVDNTDLVGSSTNTINSNTEPVGENTDPIENTINQVEGIIEDSLIETDLAHSEDILENIENSNESNTINESIVKDTIDEYTEKTDEVINNNTENEILSAIEDNADSTEEIIRLEIEEESPLKPNEEAEGDTAEHIELTQLNAYEGVMDSQDQYMVVQTSSSVDLSAQEDPDDSSVQLVEVYEETPRDKQDKVPQKKPRRTRKPIHELPMHLIGHDISKPVESVPNGRALPKPRLGVKVPYLNLTSQIVSKAELEEEILERSRAKEQANENKFARGLTQRLANKLAPDDNKKYTISKENNKKPDKVKKDTIKMETKSEGSNNSINVDESKIQNDDDLLAILEGDGEEIPLMEKVQDPAVDDSNLKLIEREIALQQLQELPRQLPKERIIKPRFPRQDPKAKTANTTTKISASKPSSPVKSDTQSKTETGPAAKTDTTIKKSISSIDLDVPLPVKKLVEIEPQVKVNMVLKTYSRKRKPTDMPEFESSSPKKSSFEDPDSNEIFEMKNDPLALPTDVYVTKSSRVIKKKVIWDPDDDQHSKSPRPSLKVPDSNKTSTPKITKSVSSEKLEKIDKMPTVIQTEKSKESKEKQSEKSEKNSPKKVVSKTKLTPKSKRGLSEVDKLLMDEGAIKMLYELKGSDEHLAKKKKDVYSVEKAEKELLKRANVLKNDLVQNTSNESPKSLRKKESALNTSPPVKQPPAIIERKMSKDSTKSSVHTPPRSPTFYSSQASMLIRRRSSSSISSDEELEENKVSYKSLKTPKKLDSSKSRKQKRNTTSESESSVKESKENSTESIPKAMKGAQYKSFTMKKSGKHVSIDLRYVDDKGYFTIDVLADLTAALKKLEKDKECNVVSLTSSSTAFCLGLDYTSLVTDDKKERIEKATTLAESVRDFLLSLLHFPKVIVAGIQSDCVGIGVTMLSLFDTVIASDKAIFRTPYASLGCMGEATFLLTYPHVNNCGLAAELLYANQHLKADEAFKRGLISKLCWPEKYKDTLDNFVSSVAQGSRQSLETTKRRFRVNGQDRIEAAIKDEMEILIQHWTSSECQDKFSKIEK
ncbi:titin isoform X1 [Diorhabda sublineata]|uniref:titin isoform X1 n=1 Tax=Diorhabda sublineata TaxID=1163346 RepID=UPI0024E0A304|nr:titin isoform X1 [Diorhabda sublineata]XP_056641740.1 titin isoform X1 [Diorhabda sublineata]XP_056641741.1 titin isoform X1 [Diorhabda sublineata]